MKQYTIKSGNHGDGSIVCPWLLRAPSQRRRVEFMPGTDYLLLAYNQLDVNKLYGLSFGFSEDNSARWGSRWRPEFGCHELIPYCHIKGQLNRNETGDFFVAGTAGINDPVVLDIRTDATAHHFYFQDMHTPVYSVPHGGVQSKYGVTRGFWFGGTQTPDKDYTVGMQSL